MSSRVVRVVLVALTSLLFLHSLAVPPAPADDKKSEADLLKALEPKLVTVQDKDVPLNRALILLAKQSGNKVEDRRQNKDDVKLKLDLKGVTFWQALDTIAREADLRISLDESDGKLALADGPHRELPVSYHGLFRVTLKRMDLTRILDADAHYCRLIFEVAWEPRFRPFFLESQADALVVQDDKGAAVEIPENARGQAAVTRRNAMELEVRVGAPKRSALKLGLLKGKLSAVGAGKMIDFTFDELAKVARPKKPEPLKKTHEGVTVNVRRFQTEEDADGKQWTVNLLLEYPVDGPKFESFQSWLIHNEIFFEKETKDGLLVRFPNNGGYESDDAADGKAIMTYRFVDDADKKLLLGKPEEWKLVYRTPGKMLELAVPFEFKDLPLP